ncbi:uncharacterized protein MONOS_7114 [Monocercomonoides exilis]|uniref:uncharacterized protein n=1 Tax=Monocercomonoides exilis TaxID=2049356 RepID=UPI00355A7C6D|nr:hypothetical protein MONOS_7114 [Monocercomonoides exilis]|eukprot:MONOS_7114.1-p1 / transcript=MONOS_7114.1 / gene=MONOS_7114 / organism=Monocercomonoides_exilis_PA203 / gene_product=unspecified product / transcript_product=unspecified product / location=Mono_scaffold00236:61382-62768(-) / protein_length=289 / sequence_SO=supercontig / SO=protein_coding / is_pseudo=false
MDVSKELSLPELRKKKVAVDSGTISNGSWDRGIVAKKQKRQAGVNKRPPIIKPDLIEKIENQVIVHLSKGETIRVKDVHKMIVEHMEQSSKDEEAKKIPSLTAAYYVIQKSSILKSAVSKQLDTAKISSQSSDSVRKWFDELSQIVNEKEIVPSVCLQNQKPPSTPSPKKTSNTTLCLCACADGSSRFKKTYNNSFKSPTDHSSAAFRSAIFDILPEALTASVAPSNIKHAFRQTGVWPVKATPVLERISGTTEKEASLNDDENKEQLFGKYSPKKKKIEDEKNKKLR